MGVMSQVELGRRHIRDRPFAKFNDDELYEMEKLAKVANAIGLRGASCETIDDITSLLIREQSERI